MAQLVIATRGGPGAKSRLAGVLDAAQRQALALAMLEDMLIAAAAARGISRVWVVTPTPALARAAERGGAAAIPQPEPADLNGAFALALACVEAAAPGETVLLLPGDLPGLEPADLEALLALAREHPVTLAGTHDGGTGAMALQSCARPPFVFGEASFERHAKAARALGFSPAVLEAASLARDLDEPADLDMVGACAPDSRTATFLARWRASKIAS